MSLVSPVGFKAITTEHYSSMGKKAAAEQFLNDVNESSIIGADFCSGKENLAENYLKKAQNTALDEVGRGSQKEKEATVSRCRLYTTSLSDPLFVERLNSILISQEQSSPKFKEDLGSLLTSQARKKGKKC